MFYKNCGKEIDNDVVVCPHCGKQVQELKTQNEYKNIIINNSSSASATASATVVTPTKVKKHYSLLLDIIMTFVTGRLLIIWMLIRSKYVY